MKASFSAGRADSGAKASTPVTAMPDKAVKLLATSIFKHLQSEGCRPKDIIGVSTQLLDLVTHELKKPTDEE